MRCEEVRQALWPEADQRPATSGLAEALTHVERCAACQEFFATQRVLGQRLRRLRATEAPQALRQRVERAIAQEAARIRGPRRTGAWVAGAGALIAAAAALVFMVSLPEIPDRVAGPLVEHASRPIPDESLQATDAFKTTSDRRALYQWFAERIDYSVDVPQIDDAQLLGGRVVELDGQRVAAVLYRYSDHPVTYYSLSAGEIMGSRVDWAKIVARSADGYELALWQEGGLARAVVAALPRSDVMRFAEECRAKALRAS